MRVLQSFLQKKCSKKQGSSKAEVPLMFCLYYVRGPEEEFRCPFQGQCRVDQVTRRFCQKCRLRKCLEIGMKKEWIMTEEEKRRKKQKIEENRARKIGVGQDDGDVQNTRSNIIIGSCTGK
ncbi:Nuclear hormone receptor family member nhr-48 [Portunus trituberculatus]|uniref:Nuclear hormone receptor family member nhr-48 n=1 Tax=Portunus trituberculatus TaxID=210409 RepID=A0A5B7G3G7_PORTR|nr:Nuclear hormone receptor family member nhr-48 [Portunus trituberculatus]